MKIKKFFWSIIYLIFLFFLPLHSQTSLSISPLEARFKISPDQSKKEVILISNTSSQTVKVEVFPIDWYYDREGIPLLLDSPGDKFTQSCREWVKVRGQNFTLHPGKKEYVRYSVSVPKNALPGDYWAALCFEPEVDEEKKEHLDVMTITQRLFVSIWVRVGKEKIQGKISSLSYEEGKNGGVINVSLLNTGRFYFYSQGKLKIKENHRKLKEIQLPEEIVLPQKERNLRIHLEKKILPGEYTLHCSLKVSSDQWLEMDKRIFIK